MCLLLRGCDYTILEDSESGHVELQGMQSAKYLIEERKSKIY